MLSVINLINESCWILVKYLVLNNERFCNAVFFPELTTETIANTDQTSTFPGKKITSLRCSYKPYSSKIHNFSF